jgi:hypothetical protein
MSNIIATTEFVLHQYNGVETKMAITISKPYQDAYYPEIWICEIATESPEHSYKISTHGADSMLALINAVARLNIETKKLRNLYKKSGQLKWLDSDIPFSFPMVELWEAGT